MTSLNPVVNPNPGPQVYNPRESQKSMGSEAWSDSVSDTEFERVHSVKKVDAQRKAEIEAKKVGHDDSIAMNKEPEGQQKSALEGPPAYQ